MSATAELRDPGFYDDVDEADYHADRDSLSHSGAKTILKAPALFRWEQEHAIYKREFDFGSAAHSLVLGAGPDIQVLEFKDRRTNAYKDAEAAAREAGKIPLLSKDYTVVEQMADQLTQHRLAAELLSSGRPEVSAYAVDEETGVRRRCRYDWLSSVILTDYKSAVSSDPNAFRRKAADFGYHCQAGWYLDVAKALGHPAEAFAFIVQMKTEPYLVSVIELSPRAVERGRELNRRAIDIYADCMATGVWPGYAPDDTFTTVDLPGWAYSDAPEAHDFTDDDLEISA
jgi:hypothetical protein